MIELVPVEYFTLIYYNVVLFVVLMVWGQTYIVSIDDNLFFKQKNFIGYSLIVLLILFIGLRPLSGRLFADMRTYDLFFTRYANGGDFVEGKDVLFEYFMMYSSYIMNSQMFFLLCATLYIVPLYFVCKRFFAQYWFYGFLMLVVSMSFLSYGTNGIRNGLGTTFFLLAISCKKKTNITLILLLSFLIHRSLALPIVAYFITAYYNKTENYLKIWLFAIPLSLALGNSLESFFLGLGFGEEEGLKGYLTEGEEFLDAAVKVGFRWDFLLYSFTGVLVGWYFIIHKKYEDVLYTRLFNVYLITNAFWILVIRANFSNRFAYLSWFMLGIIIIYPFLKMKFFVRHHIYTGWVILLYFTFTYVLNYILSSK